MNYFRWLGLIFGLAALLKPVYMHLIPWDEKRFLAKAYARQRPVWVVPVVVAGLGLVGFTWYMHATRGVPYSLVITLLFSLTAIKGIILLLDYRRFQAWVERMLERDRGRGILRVDLAAGLLGLLVILVTLLLY